MSSAEPDSAKSALGFPLLFPSQSGSMRGYLLEDDNTILYSVIIIGDPDSLIWGGFFINLKYLPRTDFGAAARLELLY